MARTISHAWRNLGRNLKRTLITLAALALTTAVLIISYALLDGLVDNLEDQITSISLGEVQVHARGYADEPSLHLTLHDAEGLVRNMESRDVIAAPRSYGYGLLSHGDRSSGCRFWGVDPAVEEEAFILPGKLRKGRFLSERAEKAIVLGFRLAGSLRAQIGDELDVVIQAADGSLGHELFSVTGILQPLGGSIDIGAAILHYQDFADLFVSEGRVHEISVHSLGRIPADRLKEIIRDSAPDVDVKTWRETLPLYAGTVENARKAVWVFTASFFLVAGLGIMNTMLMAAYERTWEFGIMKALGAAPRRIVGMILAESAVLCVCATMVGAVLGAAVSLFLAARGLDVSLFSTEMQMTEFVLGSVWKASLSWKNLVFPVLSLWAVCLPASFYPAFTAARLDPVRTLHGRY